MIDADVKITIAMPTYNPMNTIDKCISGIKKPSCPEEVMFLITYDNESTDGFQDDMIITKTIPRINATKRENIGLVRSALARDCRTEFIFYLDSDIILNESIHTLINYIKDDIGMVGYCIEANTHHLQMGNAMMRTEIARKINWSADLSKCNCLNAKEQLEALGLKTLQLPSTKVVHQRRKHAVA